MRDACDQATADTVVAQRSEDRISPKQVKLGEHNIDFTIITTPTSQIPCAYYRNNSTMKKQ